MQKIGLILLTFFTLLTTDTLRAEETRYISDELHTYTRIGPGDKYKLATTINAGEAVTLLSVNQESQYAQIRDSRGKESWIPLALLSEHPSLKSKVPALEQKVAELTAQLNAIHGDWQQKTANMQERVARSDSDMQQLEQDNERLKAELQRAQKTISTLGVQLDDEKRDLIQQWFVYGGGVAGGGLLLGLLLPRLFPRRRSNRWMN